MSINYVNGVTQIFGKEQFYFLLISIFLTDMCVYVYNSVCFFFHLLLLRQYCFEILNWLTLFGSINRK